MEVDDLNRSRRTAYERALRARVLAGDSEAWRCLYEQCFGPLFTYVFHRAGREREQTEDIVQECWMTAVRRISTFDPDRGSFESWMRGIGGNLLRNCRKRWARKEAHAQGALHDAAAVAMGAPVSDGLEVAEQVALALSELPSHYQEVLRAKYDEELPVVEIARRSGVSSKSVESLLFRARAAFQTVYQRIEAS